VSLQVLITADDVLTRRQQEVTALVAEGKINKQIGWILGLTEGTVKQHLVRIFCQVGVDSRTRLALWWVKERECYIDI
jgi:DNA-binding CsgD family transcriptional regulator